MSKVIEEVIRERKRQDEKWGQQNHHPVYWMSVLAEEVGEAAKGAIEFNFPKYREELTHAAAVAIAAVESLDRGEWPESVAGPQSKAVDVPLGRVKRKRKWLNELHLRRIPEEYGYQPEDVGDGEILPPPPGAVSGEVKPDK